MLIDDMDFFVQWCNIVPKASGYVCLILSVRNEFCLHLIPTKAQTLLEKLQEFKKKECLPNFPERPNF